MSYPALVGVEAAYEAYPFLRRHFGTMNIEHVSVEVLSLKTYYSIWYNERFDIFVYDCRGEKLFQVGSEPNPRPYRWWNPRSWAPIIPTDEYVLSDVFDRLKESITCRARYVVEVDSKAKLTLFVPPDNLSMQELFDRWRKEEQAQVRELVPLLKNPA